MISFALTTHNEGQYVHNIMNQISMGMKSGDELVVLDDYSSDQLTLDALDLYPCLVSSRKFDGDFSAHKNHLNSLCTNPWIFQIDADEMLAEDLLGRLHTLLDANPHTDLIFVPRVNTVDGLTEEDVTNFRWQVNEKGWVMWPDFQGRIYKNQANIYWQGKVHERIVGAKTWAFLPQEEDWAIIHVKDIERQRVQNELYATLT